MFNLQGSEIIFILLLALVVLGPEKLPSAIRRFTQTYAELRKMGTGFQTELKSALDEPMREMKETAGLIREAADPARMMADADAAETADAADAQRERAARALADQRSATTPGPGAATTNADISVDSDDAPGHGDDVVDGGAEAMLATADVGAVDEWADPVDVDAEPGPNDAVVAEALHEGVVASDDDLVVDDVVVSDDDQAASA